MPRTKGAVGRDHQARREAMVAKLREAVRANLLTDASLRTLADAAGVSVPTLLHYFVDRDGVITALMSSWRVEGEQHLAHIRKPTGDLEQSVRDAVHYLALGLSFAGVREMHAHGLNEGLGKPILGQVYVREVFEPTLDAFVVRLQLHLDRGQMVPCDPRGAAISLVTPILIAALHQIDLHGRVEFPLAWEAFLEQHIEGFLRAYCPNRPNSG